jgi:arsenical-resistance protein 2
MAEPAQAPGSWTDAFPAPRITAPILPREQALEDMATPETSPYFLLVDVRRTDYEGGTIVGSLNLPAHSFYMNRAALHALCKKAGVKRVAFYCGE